MTGVYVELIVDPNPIFIHTVHHFQLVNSSCGNTTVNIALKVPKKIETVDGNHKKSDSQDSLVRTDNQTKSMR